MIALQHDTRILLATRPVDFRKGIDGFVAVCRESLASDPRSGTYFAFINQSGTMIRVLAYDGTGFWLMTKRLSQGHFHGWPRGSSSLDAIEAKHLRVLLSGTDWVAT